MRAGPVAACAASAPPGPMSPTEIAPPVIALDFSISRRLESKLVIVSSPFKNKATGYASGDPPSFGVLRGNHRSRGDHERPGASGCDGMWNEAVSKVLASVPGERDSRGAPAEYLRQASGLFHTA